MLVVLGLLLTIFLIIKFADHKSSMELKAQNDAFWQREKQANTTRKVDISGLDYLHIPYEELPFMDTNLENLLSYQNVLKSLEDKPILNLTEYTNTDLKLLYGTANINFLTRCDSNFVTLIKTLLGWGEELIHQGYTAEALTVLEYGVTIQTDIGKHYLLLGELYKSIQDYDKTEDLIGIISNLNIASKDSVLTALKELKMSYFVD